jgi:hypothetical protein
MKLSWKIYLILSLVFLGSIFWASLLESENIAKQILAIPGVAALIGTLYQLLRDEARHQKNLILQTAKQEFDLAITSHMANTAFDKHVEFCEEYLAEFHNAMVTLFRNAECEELLTHASNLEQIKVRHRAWLTIEIETELEPFEQALRSLGAAAHFYNVDPSKAVSSGKMDEAHNLMYDIFGFKKEAEVPANEEIRDKAVIQKIRKILGIEALTYLRYKQLGLNLIKPNQKMSLD